MASAPPSPEPPVVEELPQPQYPALESFIETATQEEVGALFLDTRQKLGQVKGPRASYAQKVEGALDRAEELLRILVDTRERLASELKSPK